MVRILCLHGTGANSLIMKSQVATLKAALPAHWEWICLDAEKECDPAPGVEIWPGPYHNYYIIPSTKTLSQAHEWLRDVIESDGPFDGIFGFSSGGAMAASLMIQHQLDNVSHSPLFRFAIFSSASLPWMPTAKYGIDMTPLIMRCKPFPVHLPDLKTAIAAAKAEALPTMSFTETKTVAPALRRPVFALAQQGLEMEDHISYRLHPEHDAVRLRIPTVHVLGKNDFAYEDGQKMKDFCDQRYVITLEHNEGHSIPKGALDIAKLRDMIERTVFRSEFAF